MKPAIVIIVLLMLALSFGGGTASAQTPVSKEQANSFYLDCKSRPNTGMQPENLEAMCACNSAMIMEHMSVEEVEIMKQNTQDGRNMLNKMLIEVYAPCMNYPVQDMLGAECITNKQIDDLGLKMSKDDLCACVAETMGEWYTGVSGDLMRQVLEQNPNILDPLGPIMETKEFQAQQYSILNACITGN